MKPSDDIWKDITSLSSPTTNHFQNFFQPVTLRPPPPPVPSTHTPFFPPSPTTPTMLTLLTPTLSTDEDPCKRHKPNPPPPPLQPQPHSFMHPKTSPPEYSEKFRRLMKNRESAARSRARKQARANELEVEVMRLAKENAKLKKLQKEQACISHVPKEYRLHRTKSAPF